MANGLIVTNEGKKIALNRLFKSSPDYSNPSVFKIGLGSTTPLATDTDLVNNIPIQGTEVADNCNATTGWTSNADGTISLNSTTFKDTAALNLAKTGTGSTTALMQKTTPTINFTSKEFTFWIFIKDTTTLNKLATSNCLDIRFGSNSTNYYRWLKNRADLIVGWNYLRNLTIANSTVVGSPTASTLVFTSVRYVTNNSGDLTAAGDIIVESIEVASSDDFIKSFVAGYPILDESLRTSTIRALLLTTETNGFPLNEFGIFNTDGTRKCFSRTVFSPIDKTNSVQVIFVQKDRIV